MENLSRKYESLSNESNEYINTVRFIERLDKYYYENDLNGALKHLDYWENEARAMHDKNGLLAVLNEKLNYSEKTNDRSMMEKTLSEITELIDKVIKMNNISEINICMNVASLLNALGKNIEAVSFYAKAEDVFKNRNRTDTYEYALLLNDKAYAYNELEMYTEAKECLTQAIDILEKNEGHSAKLALSYIGLAHTVWDKDEDIPAIELSLDKAIINLNKAIKDNDEDCAGVLRKCIPSLYAFKRVEAARKFEEELNRIR